LALAAFHNLVIHQMDVKTTFLNGDLMKKYMKQPEGFVMLGNEHKVCKLVKSLYGLKQVPKQWHQKFDEVVLSIGFLLNQSDKCVYRKFDRSDKGVIICLYVDDMLIFVTHQNQVDKTKKFLSSRFSMKDMGEADVILGIKIKRENKGIVITQSHYIEKIRKKFNREDCFPVSTPMNLVEKLKPNTGKPVDHLEYSRAIGCLMYAITSTRPDIAYVVGRLSRFTSNPSRQHWKAITRVFKYLRGTKDYGLSYVGYPLVQDKMSRDMITVSSTMRIQLLYRGEYSQWRKRFMNYLEEQTVGEAMINSIQNGEQLLDTYLRYLQVINDLKKCGYKKDNCDVNGALRYKKKAVVVTSHPLALVAEKMKVSKRKEKVVVSLDSEGSGADDFSELKKITTFMPTRNKSLSSRMTRKLKRKMMRKKQDMSKAKCYNCKKEGHFAKDCKKTKVKDYNYNKAKMLLAKKESDEQVLLAKDQAWMESSSDSDQEINANMVFMAQIEKVLSDSDESSLSAEETIAEVTYYTSESESEYEFETL
nr:zinc finger, CCHC-type [Tanacetum cinerariifolium]